MPAFIKQFQPTFPIGKSDNTKAREFLEIPMAMRVFVPMMVFIDRDGMVREQHTGGESAFFSDNASTQSANLKAVIEKLLAEPHKPTRKRIMKKKAH